MRRRQNIKIMLRKMHGGWNSLTISLATYRTKSVKSFSSPAESKKSHRGRFKGKLHHKISRTISKINFVRKSITDEWNNFYTQKLPFYKINKFWRTHYPIYKKFLIPVSLGMLIVLAPVVWLSVKNPDKVFADWFDDNWHYRKTITITNPGAPDSDKKILFETDTATLVGESKMQNTCADTRFVDVSGQVLDYYVDSANGACNTNSTDFYILLPTINKGSTVVYFYYGNAYAESVAQTSQFSQATFSPSQSSTGNETSGPEPTAYWKFEEGYDQKENTKIEQQLEIMNTPASVSWLTGSTKSRVVTVTNSNASALTNFQVLVSVTYDSDMNSDFSDIRFTDSSGTELDHWLESKTDSTSAKFWVEVPSIAESGDTTIYLFYGNASASSASNGDNTFMFFDDFSGSSVDTNKWTVVDATGISVSGGVLNATSTTGWLQSNSAFSKAQQPVIETKIQHVTMPTNGYNPLSTWLSTSDTFGGLIHPGSTLRLYYRNGGTWTSIYDSTLVSNLLVRLRIYSGSTAAIYYYNYDTDALVASATDLSNSVDNEPIRFIRREDDINTGQSMNANWDYILVRNGATSDPTTSVSSTEFTSDSYQPDDASLGIVYFVPENYSSDTVYLEAVVSLDSGTTWAQVRSPEISAISSRTASSYTVKFRAGDGDSVDPSISVYDATNSESIYEYSLGDPGDTKVRVNNARLIIKQESGVGITQTETKTEIGSYESSSATSYTPQTDKKIYNYDSSKYDPAPTNFFEATAGVSLSVGVGIEQQIPIMVTAPFYTNSTTYLPTDNSLGLVYWDADKYSGATVYLEIDYYEYGYSDPSIALYKEDGTLVTSFSPGMGDWDNHRYRSSALTLTDNTTYTVRWKAANSSHPHTLYAARLIVIQTDDTKITDTETDVELGASTTATDTSYANLTDKKVWRYDSTRFTPTPTTYFEAVLANDTADQTTYAALYTDGALCTSQVSGSEVSVTSTSYTRVRSGSISLTDDTDYSVCIKASANTAKMINAKVVLQQSDGTNGIRDLELYQMQVNGAMTDSDATYSSTIKYTTFNPGFYATQIGFEGGTFNYFYEATMKTSAETGYARLYNATAESAVTGGEITTIAASYSRVRSSDITSNMPQTSSTYFVTQDMDTQIKNSATNTTSIANSWIIIQVSDLSNTTNTIYAELYNLTDGTSVSGSEVSTAALGTTTHLRSPSVTLTTGKAYVVRTKTSSSDAVPYYVYNAKIIQEQSDGTNGIRDLEIVQPYNTYRYTDSDATYSQIYHLALSPYPNMNGGNFAYYFESNIKTSAGTGYARLYDTSTSAAITNSEITTIATSATRVRSTDLTPYIPTTTNTIDIQLKNEATNTTTSTGSSLLIQVSNLGDPVVYVALYQNGSSCTNQVSGSEISTKVSDGIKRSVSSSLGLPDGDYMACTKTPGNVSVKLYNAKITHYQSAAQGITSLRTFRSLNTDLATESTSTYASKKYLNSYDPGAFTGTVSGSFEATLSATGSTAYAQLYNITGSEAVTGTETTTASTSYTRVQTGGITLPTSNSTLDIQIKNGSTSTTKAPASWLVLDIENILPAIVHDSTSNKLNGQLEGTTWESEQNCISGLCLEFDGIDDYVKVIDNPKLDFAASNNFTISMWFTQPYSTIGSTALISKYESIGSDGGYQIKIGTDGKVVVEISDDNTTFPKDSVTSSVSYRDSKWHHVAAVKNGTTSLLLYVDGVLEGTDSTIATTGSLANNDLLYIGDANDGTTGNWLGHIDETKIYRYARSAQEIENELYGTNPGGATSLGANVAAKINRGLLARWGMEEVAADSCGVGTTDGCDSTSNGYNGYWEGNAVSSPGKLGNSLVFDGTGDAFRVTPGGAKLSGTSLTSRIPITFDNSASAEDLTNFPVLIKLNASRISYTRTQDLGQDIRFTDSDGDTLLSYEIEKWDETGDSYVWVKVPNIPAGSTTDYIYMYFNNTSLTDGQSSENVWDSNHVSVWHLDESSGTNIDDSTTNSNDGTKTLATKPSYTANGAANGGQVFDGTNNIVSIPNDATFNMGNIMTVEAWVKPTTCATRQTVLGRNNEAGVIQLEINNSSCAVGTIINGTFISYTGTNALTAGQWNHVVYTRNGTGATHKFYVNGVEKSLATNASNNYTNPTGAFDFGRRTTAGGQLFTGTLDEVRMSNIARTADWAEATYITITDTLNTYGDEQMYTPEFNISEQVSVSGWYHPTTLDATTKYLTYGSGTTKSMYIKTDPSNAGKLLYSSNGIDERASSTTLSTNNWYYITLTGNSTETKLYVNGKLDSTVTNTTGISDLKSFYVGNNNSLSTSGFVGKVDEVKLYNTVLAASEVAGSYTSPKSPVAYYTFDQKSTTGVFDISTNNNSGTWTGSTTNRYTTGKFGSAGVFDGATDYVSTSDTPFDITTDFTLESWINLGTAGSAPYNIVSKHSTATSGGYALFVDANGAVNCLTDNGTTETVSKTANSAVTSSSGWVHVAAVREETSCKVYVNTEDKTVTAGTHTTLATNDAGLRLGSNTAGSEFFKGYLDEVKIYDYAVVPTALLNDYNAGHPIPGSPVGSAKAYWKMDEGYGNTVHNTSPFESVYDGTIIGATWSQDGKFDRALEFDGANDYVTVASGELVDQDTITIEGWVYPASVNGAHDFTIFTQNDNGSGYATHNFAISGSTGKLTYDNELPSDGVLSSNIALTASKWTHIAVVRDGNAVSFYIDGYEQGGGTAEARSSYAAVDNSLIGARYYSGTPQHQFAGRIDELKVYTAALDKSQIAQAYNRGRVFSFGALSTDSSGIPLNSAKGTYCVPGDSSTCNNPVANYSFDEKTGSTLNDISGNGNTGTIYGNATWTNGNVGGALEFDGTDDYVSIATGELVAQDNFTVEAWIFPGKVTDVSNTFTIFAQNDNDAGNFTHMLAINNSTGTLLYDNSAPSGGGINGSTTLVANTWNHVAVTRNGTTVTLYLNGTGDGTGTGETRQSAASIDSTFIGTRYYSGSPQHKFNGKISHLTVYDYARTPAQIAWDYDRGGPSLWWKLDECQGLVANDSGKSGTYDGIISIGGSGTNSSEGSCASLQTDEAWYNGASGKTNGSLHFDGSDDYSILATGPTSYAVSFWIKPASTTQSIVDLANGGITISVSSGTINANGFSSPTIYVDGYSTTTLPDTNWHQVTVVDTTAFDTSNITLGKINTSYFTGQIDEFRLFSYPLTATQVRNNVSEGAVIFN